MRSALAVAVLFLALAAAPARAAIVLTGLAPNPASAGANVAIESPDVVAGQSYVVLIALRSQVLVAADAGRLVATVPADLCATHYPVAVLRAGVRSNTLDLAVANVSRSCDYGCLDLVPDRVAVCPYRPLDPARHDIAFMGADDNRFWAASSAAPDAAADPVLDSLYRFGWLSLGASFAPGGERAVVVRRKQGCAATAPGPGLACSYGRPTIWLALHWAGDPNDPGDDFWVHLNLAPLYGLNSFAMSHTTWLHERLALVSLLRRGDAEGWLAATDPFVPQINAIDLASTGFPTRIAPFAPAELERASCLTGRVATTPSQVADGCSAGQRLVFTRRCYDEPDPSAWTWWNSSSYDTPAALCVADLPQLRMPILRSYVVELDASCRPTRPFEALAPVREPLRDGLHRQMGRTPEWGDMEPALSPDGRWVAVTSTTGNPTGDPSNACFGFYYNLSDPTQPTSGNAARRMSVCELDADGTCAGAGDAMTPLPTALVPPESQLRASFVAGGDAPVLVIAREWGQSFGKVLRDLARIDVGASAPLPLGFGARAVTPDAIHPAPP